MSPRISEITVENGEYERVVTCLDEDSGYHGIVAIHSTVLGPAVGGTRFWRYDDEEAALRDALRLSRGMTYKCALAGVPFGGGKSIIIGDNRLTDREPIFRAHGRFVETFGGRYITAEDVGTTTADMEYVRTETSYVAGLVGQSGDPSPVTALGVFRAIQAAAKYLWNSDTLLGRSVAIQGCGNVGYYLADYLSRVGAKLIVTDLDAARAQRLSTELGAAKVDPEDIYGLRADIFAPCALGGIINDQTIPQLKVAMIAGAANNQLLESRHGDALAERGILYAPDYVINAGGVINGCRELLGWSPSYSATKVDEIYETLSNVFNLSKAQGIPPHRAADRLAELRLNARAT